MCSRECCGNISGRPIASRIETYIAAWGDSPEATAKQQSDPCRKAIDKEAFDEKSIPCQYSTPHNLDDQSLNYYNGLERKNLNAVTLTVDAPPSIPVQNTL